MIQSLPRHALSAALAIAAAALVLQPDVPSAQVTFGGTVSVVNRSGHQLTILIDGQVRGAVQPQGTSSIPNVPGGYRTMFLRDQNGRVRSTTRFFLRAGSSYTYTYGTSVTYRPKGTPGAYPRPGPRYGYGYRGYSGYGRVQVLNRFPVPLQIWIGGRMFGVVGPSRDLILNQVPAGNPMLVAKNAMNPMEAVDQRRLIVQRGVLVYANLMPRGGVLRVVNSHPQPVEILVDGRPLRTVMPGQTQDIPNVPAGNRQLTARVGPQVLENRTAPIYQGQTYTWYLRINAGSIRIVNRMPEPLNVSLDNAPRGTLMPGQETIVSGVPAGSHQLLATTTTGQVRKTETLTVSPGETRSWYVAPGGGHEPHAHPHQHPHQPGSHHHHPHKHPHPGALDHHHPY